MADISTVCVVHGSSIGLYIGPLRACVKLYHNIHHSNNNILSLQQDEEDRKKREAEAAARAEEEGEDEEYDEEDEGWGDEVRMWRVTVSV